jgi:DNA-binding FadR family transcriptional regulator
MLAGDLLELRRQGGGVTPTPGSVLLRVAKPVEDVLVPARTGCTYLDVAEGVRAAVFEGRLEPLDFVPTVTDLAKWFGVARSTAQRAVTMLGAEGLIERRGARWIVRQPRDAQGLAAVSPALSYALITTW